MRYVVSAMLFVVGVIHILPLPGVLGGERLAALYGLSFDSFLCLAWSVGNYNTQVGRVFAADIVALVCLVIGAAAHVYASRGA